jgi:hypothetical protein
VADDMYECEVKTRFKVDNTEEWRWVVKPVSSISTSGALPNIRCKHCHGRVRVHKKQVDHGPADHVEHLSKQDSENCVGGSYFKGTHKLSDSPVD